MKTIMKLKQASLLLIKNKWLLWFVAIVIIFLLISAIDNFGDIREGLVDGWNGTPRH